MSSELNELQQRIDQVRLALAEQRGRRDKLLEDRAVLQQQLEQAQRQTLLYEQVALLLERTGRKAREQAKAQIERLVTDTLRAVFGPDYAFEIDLVERAGRAEAEFYIVTDYGGERLRTRIQDSRGGGIVDVSSIGLRIAMLETFRPKLGGALILDEPAKQVSDEFIPGVAQYFQQVSSAFGRQVLMVTHETHLAEVANVAYHVQLHGDKSVATRKAKTA